MNIKETSQEINNTAREKGFWDKERNVGELLMLVTSELGEALEAHRKGKFANVKGFLKDCEGKPFDNTTLSKEAFQFHIKDTFEDEIADAVIRLFDLAEGLKIDLPFHIRTKMDYNKTRERLHGKSY